MKRSLYSLLVLAAGSLLTACGSMPGRAPAPVSPSAAASAPTADQPLAPPVARPGANQVAADLGILLQQAQQELLVYQEIIASSDSVARAAVLRNKVTDYAFCLRTPPDFAKIKYSATHGSFVLNQYRGRCIHHVERLIDEQKWKNRREEVLPLKNKKKS